MSSKKLGELLRELDLVTKDDLEKALEVQQATGERLGATLLRLHLIEPEDLAEALASQQSFEGVDPLGVTPSAEALACLPPEMAFELGCLPLELHGDHLIVAMADPGDRDRLERIQESTGKEVDALIAPQTALYQALKRHFESPVPPARARAIRGALAEIRRLVNRVDRLLDDD
ncbi:MAG: hypothetical protein R3234_04625 [Thermoanaerobaculia bacterium]|nr:hypothetical protein [Thermoanaerobaculia bacterium]